jgi:hypothetical protein
MGSDPVTADPVIADLCRRLAEAAAPVTIRNDADRAPPGGEEERYATAATASAWQRTQRPGSDHRTEALQARLRRRTIDVQATLKANWARNAAHASSPAIRRSPTARADAGAGHGFAGRATSSCARHRRRGAGHDRWR